MNADTKNNQSIISTYLKDIGRYPLLSAEDESILANEYFRTKCAELAGKLIIANLRLVVDIAKEYCEMSDGLIVDLIQEGNIGLMKGIEKFDPGRGLRLSTYVVSWIRGEILRFLMNNYRLVRIGTTENERKLFHRLRRAQQELESNGTVASLDELSKYLNVPECEIESMQLRLTKSNESSFDSGEVETQHHRFDDKESIEREEFRRILSKTLSEFEATLSSNDKQLYKFRLIAEEPETLKQVGCRMNVSRTMAGHFEKRLKRRLKKHLERELGDSLNEILVA